jgi:Lon protease-like protein
MPSELIVAVEDANREIRRLLANVSATGVETHNAVLPPDELRALSRKLARVAQRLCSFPPSQPKEEPSQAAIGEYVGNLETLKRVLERVQDSLAKKRDRLKKEFEHINSARAWAEAYRATHTT